MGCGRFRDRICGFVGREGTVWVQGVTLQCVYIRVATHLHHSPGTTSPPGNTVNTRATLIVASEQTAFKATGCEQAALPLSPRRQHEASSCSSTRLKAASKYHAFRIGDLRVVEMGEMQKQCGNGNRCQGHRVDQVVQSCRPCERSLVKLHKGGCEQTGEEKEHGGVGCSGERRRHGPLALPTLKHFGQRSAPVYGFR